jgi:hypothetical protein
MKPSNEIMNAGLRPSEYVNYAERISYDNGEIEKIITRSSRAKDLRFGTWGMSIVSHYNSLAKSYVMQRDYADARRNFHNAARFTTELLDIQAQKKFDRLLQKEPQRQYHTRFTDGFPEAILADDELLLNRFAHAIDHEVPIIPGQKFSHLITNAIKFLVLGDLQKAREYAVMSHKMEYFRLPHKGYSHAILGIIDHDMLLVNEGIAMRIKLYKGREHGSAYWEFCHEATALAKLAVRARLHPNLHSPFICEPLVRSGERNTDNTIDQIFAGLEIANARTGSLMWSMLRLFPGVK